VRQPPTRTANRNQVQWRQSVLVFAARFLVGGLIIASVPLVASRFSPAVAGVVILVPVISLVSFTTLGAAGGPMPVGRASLGTLIALPSTVAFMLVVYGAIRLGFGVAMALVCASLAWLIVATPLTFVITRLGS
jgi:uncharacterized membrane protein (GlpM family)